MVGLMALMVMCHIFWARVAPSMSAASYISASTPAIAEMKIMEFQPSSFQISETRARPQNRSLLEKNPIGWLIRPAPMSISFTAPPSVERKSNSSMAHTVQEMKWGR